MKRLLLPLIAALALPAAVNAESVWLLIRMKNSEGGIALEKIQMKDMDQCESEKQKIAERWDQTSKFDMLRKFACVKGK